MCKTKDRSVGEMALLRIGGKGGVGTHKVRNEKWRWKLISGEENHSEGEELLWQGSLGRC